MKEKKTQDLENVLGSTHVEDFENFIKNNKESMLQESTSFNVYMKDLFKEKNLTQQQVFLNADIPERYGYKLLSGEKKTKQRDIILRICYAGEFTLEETQKTLKKYEMSPLYAKIERDALLMIIFNERVGSIIEVNTILKRNKFEPLRSCGTIE